MSVQEWVGRWGSDEIAVEAAGEGSESRWRLSVNGHVIDEERQPGFRRARYLCAKVALDGSSRVVEAAIGASSGARACRIFVDGELVGGDRDAVFLIPDPLSWKAIRTQGQARFLFARGGRAGLFVAGAVFIAALVLRRGSPAALVAALVGGGLSACMHANALWEVAERQYQHRLNKLDDPAWAGSITGLRRFVSLVLIGAGALLGVVAAVALVVIAASVGAPETLLNAWMLLPIAVLALGLSLIFVARAVRRPRGEP